MKSIRPAADASGNFKPVVSALAPKLGRMSAFIAAASVSLKMIAVWEGAVIMGNEGFIKLWKNDKSRRDFLEHYSEWEIWLDSEDLQATFYRFILPKGLTIVALEYWCENFLKGENESKYKLGVKYYLLSDNYFSPEHSKSISAVADYLKIVKEEFVKENRRKKECAASGK
ncbi:MAG: hypothetical protein RR315_04550 [Oscillospiraceae bacterium]